MVRLECARRYGCVTRERYQSISHEIYTRLALLVTQGNVRTLKRHEWGGICAEAARRTERKSDAEIAAELGNHEHVMSPWIEPPSAPIAVNAPAGTTAPVLATVTQLPGTAPAPVAPVNDGLTDKANAEKLAREFGGELRYIPELKKWAHWTGDYWSLDSHTAFITEAAGKIAKRLVVIHGDKAATAHKKSSLSTKGITGMVKLAEAEPGMRTTIAELDSRAYELNTTNGIVNLRTGELLPHDPTGYHTKVCGTSYDPTLATPQWNAFLQTIFEGKTDIIEFMQRLAGYACIGEVTHHILPFLYGELGNNGKSVLLKVFQECLGKYAVTLPVAVLISGRNKHTEETARLTGVRLAVCSEVGADTKWDEEKVKALTGGDVISGRFLYGHQFDFTPSHLIMIAANDRPHLETGGNSFFRRFRLIRFNYSIPEDQMNERLSIELLEKEGPGILAWMVRGAIEVQHNGLRTPPSVLVDTDEYQESEDDIGQWLDECCKRVTHEFALPSGKLFRSYKQWCENNGLKVRSAKAFGIHLGKHGIGSSRSKNERMRTGIMLLSDPDDAQTRFWDR